MSDYRASKPPRKRRPKWETVDWVELGCRGWSIDESGAELEGPDGHWFAHLDWTTLEIILNGDGEWVRRVVDDLAAAQALNWSPLPHFQIVSQSTTGSSAPVGLTWRIQCA